MFFLNYEKTVGYNEIQYITLDKFQKLVIYGKILANNFEMKYEHLKIKRGQNKYIDTFLVH